MKRLGDLTLPDSMQWLDRHGVAPVTQTVARTLSGTPVVQAQPLDGGLPVTLAATRETTWLDAATVEALMLMAGQAGATFTLVWEEITCTVLFRHQEPPAVAMAPLWPHHDQFTGTIKLTRI